MSGRLPLNCSYCGATKAEGWAWIGGERFCHGDTLIATCYMEAQWATEAGVNWRTDDE